MKAKVDQALCIGCGICENICPEVFEMDSDDKSQVIKNPIPDSAKGCTLEAEEECPVGAITHDD